MHTFVVRNHILYCGLLMLVFVHVTVVSATVDPFTAIVLNYSGGNSGESSDAKL